LGNHSCGCGTTIRYDAVERRRRRKDHLRKLQDENPYERTFSMNFIKGTSSILIRNMNDKLQILKNNYNAKLDHVDVMGDLAIFALKVQEEYFDTTFKAS